MPDSDPSRVGLSLLQSCMFRRPFDAVLEHAPIEAPRLSQRSNRSITADQCKAVNQGKYAGTAVWRHSVQGPQQCLLVRPTKLLALPPFA